MNSPFVPNTVRPFTVNFGARRTPTFILSLCLNALSADAAW